MRHSYTVTVWLPTLRDMMFFFAGITAFGLLEALTHLWQRRKL